MKKEIQVRKFYKATDGAQFSQKKASIYGKCLDTIAQKKNGTVKAVDVVNEARSRKSPLHDYFDWDDRTAAGKYRLEQARHLISHLTVIVKYDHTQKEQKAFFSVNSTPDKDIKNKVYVTFERALSEPDLRKQVLSKALDEAEYWREKYQEYDELANIFKAIEVTRRRLINKITHRRR